MRIAILVLSVGVLMLAMFWPSKVPYVVRKGATIHETIWLWRIPTYYDKGWYIRWQPSDGMFARAYCYNPEASATYRAAMEIAP